MLLVQKCSLHWTPGDRITLSLYLLLQPLATKTPGIPQGTTAAVALLEAAPDEATRACLLATRQRESGAWLQPPPMSALGFRMDDNVVRVAVGLLLGVSLCQPHQYYQYGTEVDHLGLHGLSCRMSQGWHLRHAAVNELIRKALASAKAPLHLEPSDTSCANGKRSDGATVLPWKCGRALVWDATCPDTYAASQHAQIPMPPHIWPLLPGRLVWLQSRQSSERQKSMPTSVLATTLWPSLLRPQECLDLRYCPCWKTNQSRDW